MNHIFFAAAILTAILEWLAVRLAWRRLEYIAKPGVMILLVAWLCTSSDLEGALLWFWLGALFSLAGDIFLLLPPERRTFAWGLRAFLLAHVAYIVGLNHHLAAPALPMLIIAAIISSFSILFGRQIMTGLRKKKLGRLIPPVIAYIFTISIMVFSALITLFCPEWKLPAAILVATGSTLFMISDSILAWNRFVTNIRQGRLILMITYHLGQMAILAGAALQFSHL